MDKLGKNYRDKVTGFQGIATAKILCLFGCTQYALTPPTHEGKVLSQEWFDDGRLEFVDDGVKLAPEIVATVSQHDNDQYLGNEVRDEVSGFTGLAVVKVIEAFGDVRIGVSSKVGDDNKSDTQYFHINSIVVTGPGLRKKDVAGSADGGPNRDYTNLDRKH